MRISPLFILILLCLAGFAAAQESDSSASTEIAEVYVAKKNADGKAGERADVFYTSDIPIFCVVRLANAGVATVKIDLVAANVPGVKTDSRVVSISYTTKEGEDRVNFSGKPHGVWVAGKYRVNVFIGTRPVGSIEFQIVKQPPAAMKTPKGKSNIASKHRPQQFQ